MNAPPDAGHGMYSVASQVARWLDAGSNVHVAQIVETRGFSSRDPAAALAWTGDGEIVGALFPGVDSDLTAFGDEVDGRLVETSVSDRDAVAAGLSCGGVARAIVQSATAYPSDVWQRLDRREALCLVHEIVGDATATTHVFGQRDVRGAAQLTGGADIPRLFARGVSATALVTESGRSLAVTTLWPPTSLVVVGNGQIADALADAASLLGWASTVTNDAESVAELAGALAESDAVVVLSHDRAVDVPALASVLASRAGYIGALGSRGTQAARRDGLTGRGIDSEQLTRIHGPAGLDIDAHTPAEIAVSIVAEIVANRTGSSGGSIGARQGPVHTGGVSAPPPRYGTISEK
ncbi:MAG TPA: XdhC family protein [Jatrophihabitantaceae bacterium]